MTDPRDLLDEWQELAESAKPFHRFGGVDPAMVGMLASDLLALVAAVRAVLDLRYDDDPSGSTEGHDGWCDALDEAREAIIDALARHDHKEVM